MIRRRAAVVSYAGLAVVGLLTAPAATAARDSPDDPVNRVVAISMDGLNPRAIRVLGRSRTPNFHRMMRQGASTLNARTARELTLTLPNHTGMLTGRRIDARRGGHGVSVNTDTGTTVHRAAGRYVPSVFDVVHDHGRSTALFTAKTKFALFQRSWGPKIDRFTVDTDNARLVRNVTASLRRSPRTFTFVHLSLPDQAGHARGFMSAAYLRAVRRADRLLGRILSTVRSRPALRKHTLVALTADHGGSGATHADARRVANYRVPFLVWGPGVAAGRNLYGLSRGYRGPGSARTTYRGRQPIRNGDLANLVTDVLDLPRVPGSTFNRRQRLDAFR
ncbi:alkaline phosphatase family protein [Mumia sp. zg.B53]|uniref:alkaline phosphatase family protein n=1 Tax=Mumia sp. zg.B53 TaxID=2855449 RepID=UPI001C6ED3AC|nr:alkaline phosphatase family protein [Mumia sp. zg.B53]MBW9215142.1 alkaline phosphatase family protein [Mumia sp. zg.B53]